MVSMFLKTPSRKCRSFKQIPVVVLTTTDTPEVQTKAFELGASDFLSKPTEPAIARHRIDNILKTNRRLNHILQKQEALRIKIRSG